MASLQDQVIDPDHVTQELEEFRALWDVLLPHERGQLIRSLVEQVVCCPGGEIRVMLRTTPQP